MLPLAMTASFVYLVNPSFIPEELLWTSEFVGETPEELCLHEFCSCDHPFVLRCYCAGSRLSLKRSLSSRSILIDNCTLNLKEEAFEAEAKHLTISNSTIYAMNRQSFKANVASGVQFLDNYFESCQESAYSGIAFAEGAGMKMSGNTYFNFENGCLNLEKFTEDFDVGSVEVYGVDLAQECHCYLVHQLVTVSMSRIEASSPLDLEKMLLTQIRCQSSNHPSHLSHLICFQV